MPPIPELIREGLGLALAMMAAMAAFAFHKSRRQMGRNPRRTRSDQAPKVVSNTPAPTKRFDSADQLRAVMASRFVARPILSSAESRVYQSAEAIVHELAPDARVMAQVSLGEILRSEDDAAFRAVNAKRVDLLVINANFEPLCAIEYQGGGHHQGDAAARDAVKREALRRAGVGYVEVFPGDTSADLRRSLEKQLGV